MITRSGRPGIRERVPESGAHRQHRDQYRDHARDMPMTMTLEAPMRWRQGLQTHQNDGGSIAGTCFPPRVFATPQRLSANASMIFSRMARSAGGRPTMSAKQHRRTQCRGSAPWATAPRLVNLA